MASAEEAPRDTQFLPDTLLGLSVLSTTQPAALLSLSDSLLAQFRDALHSSPQSMLPSYTRTLPTGTETGSALAIDLGGSTLRVAAVELGSPKSATSLTAKGKDRCAENGMQMVAREEWTVGDAMKALPGPAFFDWIAERVGRVLRGCGMGDGEGRAVGVTWSFPIECVSIRQDVLEEKTETERHMLGKQAHLVALSSRWEKDISRLLL